MPSKSHGGRKRSVRSKKRRMRQGSPLTSAQQPVSTQNQRPVSQVVPPATKVLPPRSPLPSVVQHPCITTELRRIAILAGIMLAILVVLYLVIP